MISMKPVKLTMSAFGPYGDIEVIDFDLFLDHSIFVITGKTGSGKTTVFDGICYALYGMASGMDRDGDSFRSHFNKGDRLTYVELEFLLRGENYYIKRVPKQMRPVKVGEGYTEQKPEAELRIPGGTLITGIERVNEAVVSLLGMNYNQFRQIVMIPQGEFREFLLADSKNREAIFRKIFGTYQFCAIQDSLDNKSRDLKNELNSLEQKQNIYIKSIDPGLEENLKALLNAEYININGVTETLDDFIEKDRQAESNNTETIKKLAEELDGLNKELLEGMEINRRFSEEAEAKENKVAFENNIEANKDKERFIQKGRKALTIRKTEDYCKQQYNSMKAKEKQLEEAKSKLKDANEGILKAKEKLESEKNKEPEYKKLSEDLTIYKKDRVKVTEYEKKLAILDETEKQLKRVIEKKNKSKIRIDTLKDHEAKGQEELEKAQKASLEYVNKKSWLDKAVELQFKLGRFSKGRETLKTIITEYLEEKVKFGKIEDKYWQTKNKYENMNELFLKGQAGLLAKELKIGMPCPVCGGLEHPLPAEIVEGTPTEEELEKQKVQYEKIDEERKNILNKLSELKAKEESHISVLENYRLELLLDYKDIPELDKNTIDNYISDKTDALDKEIKALKETVSNLKEQMESEESKRRLLKELKGELLQEEENHQKLNDDSIRINAEVDNLKELTGNLVKDLPEGITTIEAMENVISTLTEKLAAMDKLKKLAEEEFRTAEKKFTEADTSFNEKTKAHDEAVEEYNEALRKLDEDILKAGFLNRDDYKASRMEEEKIEELESAVKDFYSNLKSAMDRHEKALKAIEGLKIIDISIIEDKIKEKKSQKEEEEEQNKKVYARLKKNIEIQDNLLNIGKEIKKQDSEYRKISYLAELAKGNNVEKLSFERYVLAAYFDEIIDAANIRLKRMTDGRFELSRIQEKQKGRAQQGLDLEVYDYYTGKPRHVKVISGGESFKASLSLALGLSDVVQSTSGGISIDTMFIDEGFGTLDPESLEKSIEALLELQQSGKFVGVISHVPELKDRIRARIEITSDISGSAARIVVS